jgi:hypothetical protein
MDNEKIKGLDADESHPRPNDSRMRPRSFALTVTLVLVSAIPSSGAQSDTRQSPPVLVADSFFKATHECSHDFDIVGEEYARVPSVDSLARLSVQDAAARWLEAKDERWSTRRAFAEYQKRGCLSADSLEAMVQAMRPLATRIIGTVVDDSMAYVLHEDAHMFNSAAAGLAGERAATTAADDQIAMPPRILTLRRRGGAWRVVPGHQMGGIAVMFSRGGCPSGPARVRHGP